MPTTKDKWLKNAEAAELLAVSVRTIKYWMSRQETREALGAVQCQSQRRIPRPENPIAWKIQTSEGLKLRTFRRRYARRQNPQRDIVNVVYGVRDSLPGAD